MKVWIKSQELEDRALRQKATASQGADGQAGGRHGAGKRQEAGGGRSAAVEAGGWEALQDSTDRAGSNVTLAARGAGQGPHTLVCRGRGAGPAAGGEGGQRPGSGAR